MSNREPSLFPVYVLAANVLAWLAVGYGVWRWVLVARGSERHEGGG